MPLSIDNVIQHASGSFNSTGDSATLPATVTAGSTVVIFTACTAVSGESNVQVVVTGATFEAIGGFRSPSFDDALPFVWAKRNMAGGEQSFTLTPKEDGATSARPVIWWIAEVTGVGLDPLGTGNMSWFANKDDGSTCNAGNDVSTISSLASNNTSRVACYDTLGLAVFCARGNDATIPVFSAYTDDWLEIAQVGRVDSSIGFSMAVAYKPSLAIGHNYTDASVSPAADCAADVVSLYADGARHAKLVQMMSGAEFGSMTGATVTATPARKIFDSATANVTCVTNIKRTGNYGFKFASTSAPANVTWSEKLFDMSDRALPIWLPVYFETSLPGVDVELASIDVDSVKVGTITFRTASSKIGVKVGTGSEVLSDTTVAANQWIGIHARYDPRGIANAQHICDWMVDYNAALTDTTAPVAQTQAVGATTTVGTITTFRPGWTQSITATVYMDDLAVSRAWGAYPLGDLRLRPLKVDPAGTHTVNGASTNFEVFTANGGTRAALTSVGIRAALDDVPPVIGGSSDGLTQIAVAINDYVEIPMETFDAAGNGEAIRAVGHYAAGWAASGNPAGGALAGYDGRGLPDLAQGFSAVDAAWDDSTQSWVHWMHLRALDPADFLPIEQTHLDGMRIRFGQSNDANPDIGIHCVLTEVACEPLSTWPIAEGEGDTFRLYGKFDPVDSKIPALVVTTPAGTRGATVQWAIDGVDQTAQHVNAGQVQTFVTGAESVDDVTSITFTVDATT